MTKNDAVAGQARDARAASIHTGNLPASRKNQALRAIANEIIRMKDEICEANRRDCERAEKEGLARSLQKRLHLSGSKFDEMVRGIRDLIKLPDPVGKTLGTTELDRGLTLYRVTCPIGVIGAVFESRPDALVQIACLCLKSGNAVLLKGGSEAANSNRILVDCISRASVSVSGEFRNAVQLLPGREAVQRLLSLDEYVDLLVPRGSNEFVKFIKTNTSIPVLGHADGICHAYVDKKADIKQAVEICLDAKCQYPAVCNAIETLLVHKDIAREFLPVMAQRYAEAGVELRGCPKTRSILPQIRKATPKDWKTEYLDLILSIKTVDNIEEAIQHINDYGSHHTDTIISRDRKAISRFMRYVDSASVMSNCSTRFADGFRYGMGAEVGISTNRIHARGPVGLDGLVTYNYRLIGTGQIVAAYTGPKARSFTHKPLRKKWRV